MRVRVRVCVCVCVCVYAMNVSGLIFPSKHVAISSKAITKGEKCLPPMK